MSTFLPKQNIIDDLPLQRYAAIKKMESVIDFVNSQKLKPIIKTASVLNESQEILIKLFSQMISSLNLSVNSEDVKKVIASISTPTPAPTKDANVNGNIDDIFNKIASSRKNGKERRDDIKIVSKKQRESHFQIDISKDIISRDNKKMFMVSCYARDAYLGRYLIKRNFFYTADREASADEAYGEILLKMGAIKDRYYNDLIEVSTIFTQIRTVLDGVISEIKMEEDSIPTNVNR